MSASLPSYVQKYFWGDDPEILKWPQHQEYITETILEKGDQKAVQWLFKKTDKKSVLKNLDHYNLSDMSANFWRLYLS
jgi:hypothetical protein